MSQTLDRALQIMEILQEQPARVTDVAKTLGVHHSTALRLMHTLQSRRFIYREDDGRYRLGSAVLAMAEQTRNSIDVRKVALPYMRELNDATRETVHLAVLENTDVVYIEKLERKYPIRMYSRVGFVAPPHCTGVGKAIIAFLPDDRIAEILEQIDLRRFTPNTITTKARFMDHIALIRERGYATDEEEHETGIQCIAAPIRYSEGSVRTSMSLTSPTSAMSRQELLDRVPELLGAAESISRELGWSPNRVP